MEGGNKKLLNETAKRHGKLFIISAPSGTGKTTLVRHLCETDSNLFVSVSHTTRPKRREETDGVAYHFTEVTAFQALITANRFLEHEKIHGHYYGTSRQPIEAALCTGRDVILVIDWRGARNARQLVANSTSILLLPPSYKALEMRLKDRGEDEAAIEYRLKNAVNELSHYKEYDFMVVNDKLEQALADLRHIITAMRRNRPVRLPGLGDFVTRLIAGA